MIVTYIRSSSYTNYDYCAMQYFLTYVLGHRSPSGKKAQLGTIVHKVMECLAACTKETQDHPDEKDFTIDDDALGLIEFTKRQLNTKKFVANILDESYNYYTRNCNHNYNSSDLKFCKEMVDIGLSYNNGQFDPRKRHILATEPRFDIPIEEDWARYETEHKGKIIKGQLAIKGTVDLITKVDDNTIEVIDWKGLPTSTLLPTPSGWTTMGDINVGDTVFDISGNPTKVIGKSKKKHKFCYKLTFDDTNEVICDDEHLWFLDNGQTVPVTELEIGDKINITKPLQTENIDLPIDPYLLGVWLGDGRNRSMEITSEDNFIFEEIKNRNHTTGVNQEKRNKKLQTRVIYKQTSKLRELNLVNNKHIPKIYLRASYEQRLDLLRGLMDTDGNVNKTRKQAVFTTCNKKLSDDVKELLLTLGQRVNQSHIKRSTNFSDGKIIEIFPLHFRPIDINPFLLPRKASQIENSWGPGISNKRRIQKIEYLGKTYETQCIMVDSSTSTYLCTKNMIPTHNTGQRKNWATGEEKTYEKLLDDPQLLLYNYAISHLYPTYDHTIMSIFFLQHGGPFSLCFDKSDHTRFLDMLRLRFKEIQNDFNPRLVHPQRKDFRCQKLCHFYKTNWPGTNQSMCQHVEDSLHTIGYKQTVAECTRKNFNVGYYEAPG